MPQKIRFISNGAVPSLYIDDKEIYITDFNINWHLNERPVANIGIILRDFEIEGDNIDLTINGEAHTFSTEKIKTLNSIFKE